MKGAHDPTSLVVSSVILSLGQHTSAQSMLNVVSAGAAWESGWSRTRDDLHDEEVMQKDGIKLYITRRRGRNAYTAVGSKLIVPKLELRRQF